MDPFETIVPIVPQMTFNTKKVQGTPYMVYYSITTSPKFHLFHSTASRFQVTGADNFETSAPDNLKMTLNTKRSKVLHTHVITTPQSQIANFTLWTAIFEVHAILRQMHQ